MGIFTPDVNTLRELYKTELQKALNMEQQIVEKGLPTMIENASSPELANAFQTHLEESREQVARLKQILEENEGDASDKTCKAISALISEGSSSVKDAGDPAVRDVVLIAAGNQVEHHEIAVYGTLISWGRILGETSHVALLERSLQEEKKADELLTSLSDQINIEAPVA